MGATHVSHDAGDLSRWLTTAHARRQIIVEWLAGEEEPRSVAQIADALGGRLGLGDAPRWAAEHVVGQVCQRAWLDHAGVSSGPSGPGLERRWVATAD